MKLKAKHLTVGPYGLHNIDFYARSGLDSTAFMGVVHNERVISVMAPFGTHRTTVADAQTRCRTNKDRAAAMQWLSDMANVLLCEEDETETTAAGRSPANN